jgi:vacuolar-type H+-ATPase subunit H
MHRLPASQPLATALASLALMASPFGCGSGEPTAAVPAPPVVVADAPPTADSPTPLPFSSVGSSVTATFIPAAPEGSRPISSDNSTASVVDPNVRLTGELKGEAADARQAVNDAAANLQKAAADAQAEAKQRAGAIKSDAQKAAEDLKAGVHQRVGAARNNARKAVADAESKAKDQVNAAEEAARKAAEDALNKLLPSPKP